MPSARLELAQLSPLPPQDSVSTNFTTTAASYLHPDCERRLAALANPVPWEFTLKSFAFSPAKLLLAQAYLDGISAAPEAATAGAGAALAGACGAVAAAPCNTLPPLLGRMFPK